MIRILHYIGALELGGSQALVMELYRNINRDQYQFDFVVFPNERGPLYEEILSLGGRVFECPKYNGINHVKYCRWWDTFLDDHPEYKVIHGHVRSIASIYLPIIRRKHRFSIIHSHSMSNGHGIQGIIKAILQRPIRNMADYYMACSEEAGKWLFGDKVVSGEKYLTLPNSINIERFAYSEKNRMDIRKKYGIQGKFVVGHVGRFVDVKNHSFLLDVFEMLVNSNSIFSPVLMLVGDGPLKEEMEKAVAAKGLENNVIFAGNRTDTESYYSAMDVFAFPSKWEGLGIATVEAQVSGLQCIISDVIPPKADIDSGIVKRLGLNDPSEWVNEILEINKIISADEYTRFSRTVEAADAGYDISRNVKLMEEIYYKAESKVSNAS